MNNNIKYMEYRMSQLKSSIEFMGGYMFLSDTEKKEYERIRAYFMLSNKLNKKKEA